MSKPIQTPRPGQALQAEFDTQGRIRPALDEHVIPTAVVADVSEYFGPRQQHAASGGESVSAGVGEYPAFRLYNRITLGDQRFVMPKRLTIRVGTAMTLVIANADTGTWSVAPLAITSQGSRDLRDTDGPNGQVQDGVLTALPTASDRVWRQYLPATTQVFHIDLSGWVLKPGDALVVFGFTANTDLFYSVEWEESETI